MRPKARGLAQHGSPTGWLEESDPAGVILNVMDWPYRLPFPYRYTVCPDRSCPAASRWNFQLLLYIKCTQPSVVSYVTQWPGTLVGPCLLSVHSSPKHFIPFMGKGIALCWISIHGLGFNRLSIKLPKQLLPSLKNKSLHGAPSLWPSNLVTGSYLTYH
jgi:hypothetical protein